MFHDRGKHISKAGQCVNGTLASTFFKRPTHMPSMMKTATRIPSTGGILSQPGPSSRYVSKLNPTTDRRKNDKLPSGKVLNHTASQCKRMIQQTLHCDIYL